MKKYFNKGLMYQWFNSAKMMIILGIVIWGFVSNLIIRDRIYYISYHISDFFENGYITMELPTYMILGGIFILIHFISQGINKKNNNMFLTSAPYTQKQIKYNEFLCLMINLMIFTAVFIYMSLMSYVKNYYLMTIIDGYFKGIGLEALRIILFGTIGILILLIIDSMFSNTMIGIICMIAVIPAALLSILFRFFDIIYYLPIRNILKKIDKFIFLNVFKGELYLLDSTYVPHIESGKLLFEIFIIIFIIIVLLFIYYLIQKKYKIQNNTKIFTSRLNEKIIVILSSIGVGSFASTLLLSRYIEELKEYDYKPLFGMNLVKGLSLDLIVITVVSIIVYKIINKVLKTLQL